MKRVPPSVRLKEEIENLLRGEATEAAAPDAPRADGRPGVFDGFRRRRPLAFLIHRRAEFNAATMVFAAPSAHESGDAYRVMSRLRLISRITGARRMNVMLSLNRHMWSTLAVLVILIPTRAPAQTVANSFEQLRRVLKQGQTVVVTDTSGQRTKGKVADVSPSSLVVFIPEARTFAEGTVTEIRRPDTLRNGALTGLGVGLGAGIAIISAMCADGPGCGPSVQVGVLTAGIGAAVGAGIDALVNKGGRVLYRSRQQTLSLTISPLAGKDRQGVLASVRF